jgi:hypothetical protein
MMTCCISGLQVTPERTTYKLPCTLLKEAQLSSRTLSRPGMPRWLPYHLIQVLG